MTMRKPARRENKVEAYLKKMVESAGGACEKHANSGANGDPDRLVSFLHGFRGLVETKWAEDAEPEDYQIRRHNWWKFHGMPVVVLRSKHAVDMFIKWAPWNPT
jgi:hypothetical protein